MKSEKPGITAVVIDDEKPSRDVLCNYLREYCPEVDIVGTAGSVKSAVKAIKKSNPGLIFLDIELGDGKGFDLLEMFPKAGFKVVFITAYSEYAVKAFRFSAIDYLLKPIKIDELKESVDRAKNDSIRDFDSDNLSVLLKNLNNSAGNLPTLAIPNIKGYEILKISDIIMCRADGYCTNFYLLTGRKVVSSKNLKHYEDLLNGHSFLRVHHSYIVNLSHVSSYSKQGEIFLAEGHKASLGDAYKELFIRRLVKK